MGKSRGRAAAPRFGHVRQIASAVIGVLLATVISAFPPPQSAAALSGSEFMPGLIISDSLFYDANAMSQAEIQSFLAARGSGLAGMSFNLNSRGRIIDSSTGNLRCDAIEGGFLSAAAIIYRAQRACGISAKVLLVTLQKEQSLVTRSSPSQGALDRAMGYACPDTAPCAPTTLGFGNQVYSGALQLNTYKASIFARQPGWHSIQFNPDTGCGSTQVYIQNYATAALYNYTPYQPNAAALGNLGGTGDYCSSYGNRNFWWYYNNWFGSTLGTSAPFPVIGATVEGPSTVGATLTARPGSWSGAPSFTYAWMVCTSRTDAVFSSIPTDCAAIAGATGVTYTTKTDQVGKYIGVLITGTNSYGSTVSGGIALNRVGSPQNTDPPVVSGSTAPGAVWTVDTGTWTGVPMPTIVIYWLRCTQPIRVIFTTVPTFCEPISGARSETYTATAADIGSYLTAQVGGNSPLGFGLAGALAPLPVGFPVNTVAPTVTGSATVGSVWTANTGSWDGSPTPSIVLYWLRCAQPITTGYTTVPAGCSSIPGATGTQYTSTMQDVGMYLTAQVAGNSSRGFALAGALNSTAVRTDPPANSVPPTVSGGSTVGSTWTVDTGSWTGSPTPTIAVYWLRCSQPVTVVFTTVPSGCSPISGATGTTYVAATADAGMYLTAQLAGNSSVGFALAGAKSTTAIERALPANTVAPTVSGSPVIGATWTVDPGVWTGLPSPTIVIFWLRCTQPIQATYTSVPQGCAPIAGANSSTYVSSAADSGMYLTAQLAGNSPLGFALAGASNTTRMEGAASSGKPTNTVAPSITGAPAVGSQWTVDTGTWTGSPTIVVYWLRCAQPITAVYTSVPAGCVPIPGANSTTYTSTSADAGRFLTAQVAGNSSQGFSLAGATNSTATQGSERPANTVAPSVAGAAAVGSTWTASIGTWTGSPAPTMVLYWLRCSGPITQAYTTVPAGCVPISGANANTYAATAADVGKYLTVQVAGNSPLGFALAGALNSTVITP